MTRDIYENDRATRIDDFCFFPKQTPNRELFHEATTILKNDKRIRELILTGELPFETGEIPGYLALIFFNKRYESDMQRMPLKKQPAWAAELPKPLRRYLNTDYEFKEAEFFKKPSPLPYTKIDYACLDGGLVAHLHDVFNMHRLYHVRQLGFLRFPLNKNIAVMPFQHTRGVHQLDTAAVGMLMVQNNPELHSQWNMMKAAFCSHDACTPAGSDTTKYIDPKAFNEEANFNKLFLNPGWNELRHTFSIDEELLYDTVQGKGIYGQILDIADKIAYTARDIAMFIGAPLGAEYRSGDIQLFKTARNIIRETPHFASLWENVSFYDKQVVFDNAKALERFLFMRAIMTAELYKNDRARIIENVLARKLIRIPYEKGEISAGDLLNWNDAILEEFLRKKFGISFFLSFMERSEYKEFKTERDRQEYLQGAVQSDMLAIIDDYPRNVHSGTEKFKVIRNGDVATFAETYPEASKAIDSILVGTQTGFPAYMVSKDDLHIRDDAWKIIKEHEDKQT